MGTDRYTIKRIQLAYVSSYLIYSSDWAILVDSGTSGSEKEILDTIRKEGLAPTMVQLLILTHVHFDHAGSAKRLKELTGCNIVVHQEEADRLKEGFTLLPNGTRWKAKILVGLGRVFARRLGKFPGTEADILVKDSLDLKEFGVPGNVIHTPGHTAGSQVVLLENGELFAGDTVFGLAGKQHFPPFAEDLPALIRTWKELCSLQVKTIYPAHGHSFRFENFLSEYDKVLLKYDRKTNWNVKKD